MKVRKEYTYTMNFSREEINKVAEIVGYIYDLSNEFDKATDYIEYSEYPPVLRQLDDCLERAKRALDEYYNVIINYYGP